MHDFTPVLVTRHLHGDDVQRTVVGHATDQIMADPSQGGCVTNIPVYECRVSVFPDPNMSFPQISATYVQRPYQEIPAVNNYQHMTLDHPSGSQTYRPEFIHRCT